MNILHTVQFYHPSVGGMQEVVKQLSERLVKLGHSVTVVTSKDDQREETIINGVKIVEFDISGNIAKGLSGEVENYRQFLLESNFDIITNFAAQQWATDIALPLLKQIKGKKVFVPTGFSGLYQKKYSKYFETMKYWIHEYDMNVFLSDDYRDINFARVCGVEKRILIPNGAGEDEFLSLVTESDIRSKLDIPEDDFLILHVGSHTRMKGHGEAIEIFRKAKLKNITFLIVANDFGSLCTWRCRLSEKVFNLCPTHVKDNKRIIVTELSRAETLAAYRSADLFLFPSNIECSPLVLFECMASKTPFLSSDVGNAKEIISWGNSGILLPTIYRKDGSGKVKINESTAILENIYEQSENRMKMAESGYISWIKRFTWEKITKDYEDLYIDLYEKY